MNTVKSSDEDIDIIYEVVDSMMKLGEWHDLSRYFYGFISQVEDMPLDIILAYVVSSKPGAQKIQYRRRFINECKKIHTDEKIWIGL